MNAFVILIFLALCALFGKVGLVIYDLMLKYAFEGVSIPRLKARALSEVAIKS